MKTVEPVVEVRDSIAAIPARDWNRLTGGDPFLRHEFLHALHETGCASADTGWAPRFLILRENGALAGAMPLYLKTHSYGEYVFDWAWADAYQRHGLHYYPKLLNAVPFTPVSGPRLLAEHSEQRRQRPRKISPVSSNRARRKVQQSPRRSRNGRPLESSLPRLRGRAAATR